MNKASLAQWLAHLETLHPQEIDLGLARVRQVAEQLALLPMPCQVITVAGTNGKGSTVAVLEALSCEFGVSCGASTSPHFLAFNERIRVNGENVADEDIVAAFEAIDAARGEVSLTYFEFATLAALWVFRARDVELAILEVGLGGRLDAVNIVDADVAVVTSIALDHQAWLGNDRTAIAGEKLGILRAGQAAVIVEPDPPEGMAEQVAASAARPLWLGRDFQVLADNRVQLAGESDALELPALNGLLADNVAGALQAWVAAGRDQLSAPRVAGALERCSLTGRRQQFTLEGRHYVLDVAHNPAAVSKLLELIELTTCKNRVIAIFSAMADKDLRAMIQPCVGVIDAWFLGDLSEQPRAAEAADVADLLRQQGVGMVSTSKNLRQALRRAQSICGEGDMIVVFGSFHTVAAVMPSLEKDRRKQP
jgi:dihydrofolate synthase/folylpolyglutamate synthase